MTSSIRRFHSILPHLKQLGCASCVYSQTVQLISYLHTTKACSILHPLQNHVIRCHPHKCISTSPILFKKNLLDAVLYNEVCLFSTTGSHICNIELIVAESFCHSYKYVLEQSDKPPVSEDTNMKSYILKQRKDDAKKVKVVKEIRMSARIDMSGLEQKVENMKKLLMDHGALTIVFTGKPPKEQVSKIRSSLSFLAKVKSKDDERFHITLKQINEAILQTLIKEIHAKEEANIRIVKQLLKNKEELSS